MDIEIKPRPFTKEQLLRIRRDLRSGKVRRFGAIVNHRKLNFTHNALISWNKKSISPALSDKLKAKDYISHIYLRKPHPLWPYVLYTMVHAQSKEELASFIKELSELLSKPAYKVLNTLKEFKKTSFSPS